MPRQARNNSGSVLIGEPTCCLLQQTTITTAGNRAREGKRRAVSMWSPGVRMESIPRKGPPWSPPESKPPSANPCVFSGNVSKSLIFLKWHGRGQGFESLQVHQSSPAIISTDPLFGRKTSGGPKSGQFRRQSHPYHLFWQVPETFAAWYLTWDMFAGRPRF